MNAEENDDEFVDVTPIRPRTEFDLSDTDPLAGNPFARDNFTQLERDVFGKAPTSATRGFNPFSENPGTHQLPTPSYRSTPEMNTPRSRDMGICIVGSRRADLKQRKVLILDAQKRMTLTELDRPNMFCMAGDASELASYSTLEEPAQIELMRKSSIQQMNESKRFIPAQVPNFETKGSETIWNKESLTTAICLLGPVPPEFLLFGTEVFKPVGLPSQITLYYKDSEGITGWTNGKIKEGMVHLDAGLLENLKMPVILNGSVFS
jgi:hypothetical protein